MTSRFVVYRGAPHILGRELAEVPVHLVEWLGYAASIVTAASLVMSSVLRLRWLNLAGALLLVAYGFFLGAAPVVLLNLFIAVADGYYLFRMYADRESFRTLPVEQSLPYLRHFLAVYEPDLRRFFPDFDLAEFPRLDGFYVLRNAVTAGLFVGRRGDDGSFEIKLDYAVPRFRDFKVGRHVFVDAGRALPQAGLPTLRGTLDDEGPRSLSGEDGLHPHG